MHSRGMLPVHMSPFWLSPLPDYLLTVRKVGAWCASAQRPLGCMVSGRSANHDRVSRISNTPHSGVDGIHAVHGFHHQLEEERPLALVPSDLSGSVSGTGVHDCDHYAGMVGCDWGRAGEVCFGWQDTVRAGQEATGSPVLCAPGGPARVVVHETSTTVVQGYSQEVRRQPSVQQSFGPSPARGTGDAPIIIISGLDAHKAKRLA